MKLSMTVLSLLAFSSIASAGGGGTGDVDVRQRVTLLCVESVSRTHRDFFQIQRIEKGVPAIYVSVPGFPNKTVGLVTSVPAKNIFISSKFSQAPADTVKIRINVPTKTGELVVINGPNMGTRKILPCTASIVNGPFGDQVIELEQALDLLTAL